MKIKAFMRLVKPFRSQTKCRSCAAHTPLSLRIQGHKPQQGFGCSLCNSYGFTLAETLITLTILGVVAAISIPGLVRRHVETANRTKIRKAMRSYDLAINKMVIENGTRSDETLTAFAGNEENNCSGASNYFKIADGSGCKFKTSDGVWWDITNIRKTIVALKEDDLNEATADSDTNRAFYFQAWFDRNATLRVNDLAAAQDKDRLQALYDYIYSKTSTSNAEVTDKRYNGFSQEMNKLKNGDFDKECENPQLDYDLDGAGWCVNCSGCTFFDEDSWEHRVYDSNGNWIMAKHWCDEDGYYCSDTTVWSRESNNISYGALDGCDDYGENCSGCNNISSEDFCVNNGY